jgi:imidazolonepropionase
VSAVAINGAAQVLRPPEDGLSYLRHDRARELRTEPGSLLIDGETIARLERSAGLEHSAGLEGAGQAEVRIDASGCALIPGFVDCHTHLPFAGWREREYERKVAGESYESIARAGGGIRSSARSLAQADDDQVLEQAEGLASEMLAHGTTTFECKSGYGLSAEGEVRAVRLAAALAERVAQQTRSTALLAHAVPEGYDSGSWMDAVARMLPDVLAAGAVSALDIYVESVAFSNHDLRRMGELARENSLDLRAHVEQFNANRSVPVAVAAGARSVDHLSCLPDDEIPGLPAAQTAAVLLPGAELMGEERVAPGRKLADAGAICVLATDLNPGTSPILSMPVMIGLAVRRYRWSALEALLACTLNAAWVLRMSDTVGSLEVGKRADLLVLDGPIERTAYRFGRNPVAVAIVGGAIAYVRPDSAWRIAG